MAPIPVAQSDALMELNKQLKRAQLEKAMAVRDGVRSKELLQLAQDKIAEFEAVTPDDMLVQVVQWVAFVFYY
jgi:hypothetical protein